MGETEGKRGTEEGEGRKVCGSRNEEGTRRNGKQGGSEGGRE